MEIGLSQINWLKNKLAASEQQVEHLKNALADCSGHFAKVIAVKHHPDSVHETANQALAFIQQQRQAAEQYAYNQQLQQPDQPQPPQSA